MYGIILPVLLLSACGWTNHAMAENQNERLVDLILVMESTTGMKTVDPNQVRKHASKKLIALLDPRDRASVISFSGDGYPVAYITHVDSTKNIKQLFAAVDKLSAKGQYRNLHGAMEAVKRVIERDPGTTQHETHVIIFSIGAMHLAETNNINKFSDDIKNKQLAWLQEKNITIHSVVMGEETDHELLKQLSTQTKGHHQRLASAEQLSDVFNELLFTIKQRREVTIQNPNLQNQSFVVSNGTTHLQILQDNESTPLSITTPSGKKYTRENHPSTIRWVNEDTFRIVNIHDPEAGIWHFTGIPVTVTSYPADSTLIKYKLLPDTIKTGDNVRVVAWLEKNNNTITDSATTQFIKARLQISYTEGSSGTTTLFPMKTQPGKFTATVNIEHAGDTRFKITMQDRSLKQEVEFQRQVLPSSRQTESDKPTHQSATKVNKVKANKNLSTNTDNESGLSQNAKTFPALEQALIVFTVANAIFILLGLIIYVMKRRLNRFSTDTLASIHKDQSDRNSMIHNQPVKQAA